jgi:NADPH-dependent glutamate synthase beta subunit-like oxidoreductase
MSDKFQPITMEQLAAWVFTELETRGSIFGVPRELFFVPKPADEFATSVYGQRLETPFGVAAGPHSQMAQNIIVAWLCGARFIELKTVQTLDEIEVSKPCIDMQDEGYNVEWSQELKVRQSFDEYVRAWVLIHALHRKLGFPGEIPGVIFNASVGYNMEGLLKPNMQGYLKSVKDASELVRPYVGIVAKYFPEIGGVAVSDRLADNVTLSTMHGCPPDEIEKIAAYLIGEWGFHTNVKLNPTLLGPERLRQILNKQLGYADVVVPDSAFGHDLKYADAVPMLKRLRDAAKVRQVQFGVKLSNTLEVQNHRDAFAKKEKMMYMSGRALHAVTVNLAAKLADEFKGGLMMSFSAGADAFNAAHLLRCGMKTVTVCSDILKTGGYLRLRQYVENTAEAMKAARAADLPDFVCKEARRIETFGREFEAMLFDALKGREAVAANKVACKNIARCLIQLPATSRVSSVVRGWAAEQSLTEHADELMRCVTEACARINLEQYGEVVLAERTLMKRSFERERTKTSRPLGLFDCIMAPCTDECPVNQKVPQYMNLVRQGKLQEAIEVTRSDNPLPSILGRACNHLCEEVCVRTHLDEPLAIREMKRFIMEQEKKPHYRTKASAARKKVAVIGGGPCGLSVAYFLAQAGYGVTIFEARPYVGGMVSGTIPAYRAAQAIVDQDLKIIRDLGVEILCNQKAGKDFTVESLRKQGFEQLVVGVGAQQGKKLGVEGDEVEGVLDALEFLRSVKEGKPMLLGERVGVIGGGDVAMDCARSAWRLKSGKVSVIYRRSIDQMPAAREEVEDVIAEGIEIVELAKPLKVISKRGKMTGLECLRVTLGEKDSSGRRRPVDIPTTEFVIPLDTLIVAVSQAPDLGFLADQKPELTAAGYLKIDPATMETSIPGVYAGGDIALNGPESIVKALGDGRKIAESIRRKEGSLRVAEEKAGIFADADAVDLLRRKSHRKFRVSIPHLPPAGRNNFDEVIMTMTEDSAREETGRCLDCQLMCSICTSVCPNLAIMTYRLDPFEMKLPELKARGGRIESGEARHYRVGQPFQIAILNDFCNECGNCATFCPTAGKPYRDKPRLYLQRSEFEAESDNAFMVYRHDGVWSLCARFGGATHEVVLGHETVYSSPRFKAYLDPKTLAIKGMVPVGSLADGETLSLEPCVKMLALLSGIRKSLLHLPIAT